MIIGTGIVLLIVGVLMISYGARRAPRLRNAGISPLIMGAVMVAVGIAVR